MKKNNKDIRKLIKYYPSLQEILDNKSSKNKKIKIENNFGLAIHQAIGEGLWNNKSLTISNGESFSSAFDNMWDKCDDETKLNKEGNNSK